MAVCVSALLPQLRDWLQKWRPLHVLQEHVPGRQGRRRLGPLQGEMPSMVVILTSVRRLLLWHFVRVTLGDTECCLTL